MNPAAPVMRHRAPGDEASGILRVEGLDHAADVLDLIGRYFSVDRQRQRFLGEPLTDREIALPVAEVLEADLKVQGQGIVDLGSDAVLLEVRLECVALRGHDAKLIIDVARLVGRGNGRNYRDREVGDPLPVERGVALAAFGPGIQVAELDAQYGGLERVEAGIDADPIVVILALAAVDAESGEALAQRR